MNDKKTAHTTTMNYTLDPHGEELFRQYQNMMPVFKKTEMLAVETLQKALQQQNIYVTSIEHRIKTEKSLIGKLELKGAKYSSISDITDIVGIRINTFYSDDVDKVAAIVKRTFDVDWKDSVDKRKQLELHSFGYSSLHYICRLPKSLANDPQMPELSNIRFELQMRTALQHVWSTVEHDIGYKGGVKIPNEYRRQFSRLAGMLELIDDEFSRLRVTLTDYRRKVQSLVSSGQLDEVLLDSDNFRSYLEMRPFDRLNKRIAAVNQAEIYPTPLLPFVRVFSKLGLTTLGDVERLIADYSEDAYQLALSQLAVTDLDIIAENVGPTNLCIVYILRNQGGKSDLIKFYQVLNGDQPRNITLAENMMEQAKQLSF